MSDYLFVGMTIYHKTNNTKAVIIKLEEQAVTIELTKEIKNQKTYRFPLSHIGEWLFFNESDIDETIAILAENPNYLKYENKRIIEYIEDQDREMELFHMEMEKEIEIEEHMGIKDKHKKWLIDKGLPYKGVKEYSLKKHRVTHCYSCKQHLDNSINMECNTCGWIICSCGACGCGYDNY